MKKIPIIKLKTEGRNAQVGYYLFESSIGYLALNLGQGEGRWEEEREKYCSAYIYASLSIFINTFLL